MQVGYGGVEKEICTLNIKVKCFFCSILDLELKSWHLKEASGESEKH